MVEAIIIVLIQELKRIMDFPAKSFSGVQIMSIQKLTNLK